MSYTNGDVLGDRYEVKEIIGAGGMGEVYRAWDRVLERDVAVKVLLGHLAEDDDLLERFRREARVLARVRDPGIIGVYDMLRTADGQQAIVLELVPGRSLDVEISESAPIDWYRCAQIGSLAASALAAAHAQNIVHRDVKPSNILVEPNGSVRVADFGIARLQGDRTMTRGGESLGTPAFMSPEQVQGEPVAPQSDIYSLGAVLFLAATGEPPFETDAGGLAAALVHVTKPVPDPAVVNPDLPPAAREIIMRALAKDPADRFASAEEMGDALRQSAGIATATLPVPTSTADADGPSGPPTEGAPAGATRIVAAPVGTPPPEPPAAAPPGGRPPGPPPTGPGDSGGGNGRRRGVLLGVGAGAAVIVAVLVGLLAGGAFSGSDEPATTESMVTTEEGTTEEDPTTEEGPATTVVTVTEQGTTETIPEQPTDPPPGPEVFRTAGFQSPSGNLRCNVAGGLLTCSRGNDGLSAFMDATSPADTIFDDVQAGGVVVPYGSDWENGPFRCDSESSGVTCVSTTSGEGFFMSRDVYEPFSG